jgi:predicted nucleic acid-binding protein
MVFVDTDVMIWALRGHAKADRLLLEMDGFSVAAVAYMELLQGLPDKVALRQLKQTMRDWRAQMVVINEAISSRAIFLMEQRLLSHGLLLGDALIAATAIEKGLPLLSANSKHFQGIEGLELLNFKP